MANVPFSLRLDADVKSKLKHEAQQLNRSESFIAATAIRQYLAACEQKRMAIDVAIKQADQGSFIASDAMGAWVDSWGSDKELDPPAADVKIKK
ncbi:MAG TPA: hypothetical protein DDW45_07960 [Gammaproteobacteria bacterium]|nr:hypothetical protein [Gammaproteobacteria bacterium]